MKFFYSCLVLFIGISSCNKPPNNGNNGGSTPDTNIDFTYVPSIYPNRTIISAYVEQNNFSTNPVSLKINNTVITNNINTYSTNSITNADRYLTVIDVHNTQLTSIFFDNQRYVPTTLATRNYIDVNNIRKTAISSLTAPAPNQWLLPGGGKITIAPRTGGNSFNGDIAVVDPGAKAFSITNPDFTIDSISRRWFIRSFFEFKFSMAYGISTVGDMTLNFPIPAAYQADAPDSIRAYYYTSQGSWVQKGFAKKINNSYEKRIDSVGMWNFGTTLSGVYKTFKIRTDANVPVTNAIVRFRNRGMEIASGRSDIDGNAVCFIPTNEVLGIEIPVSWNDVAAPAFIASVGPYANDADATITVPALLATVITIKGTAVNCSGVPIQNGMVTVVNRSGFIHCYIPVINGQYSAALIRPTDNEIYLMRVRNETTGDVGDDTAVALRTGRDNIINLTTCPTPTNLFFNYSVDGNLTSITSNGGDPLNPLLAGETVGFVATRIECHNYDDPAIEESMQFDTHFLTTGTFPAADVNVFFINGVVYQSDRSKPLTLIFSRYDLLPGGYIIGSLDLWFKDAATISHHLVANFKVKRIS